MTDPVKEQLSACLDGELPEAELDLLLKQAQRDPRFQQAFGRYALMGEVLRAGNSPIASPGFASRVSQAIAAEAEGQAAPITAPIQRRATAERWLRPVGGAAIAAGVAAFAVMVLQPQLDPSQQPDAVPGAVVDASQQASLPANDRYIVPASAPVTQVPAAYLAKYVMAHSEYALPLGRRAVLSSVLSDDESELSETVDISTPADAETLPEQQSKQAPKQTP
jgi:sigma-E factor negative regulatory protein RseA